ncbi:unnamed protein product [Ceutorhynchus assimilis]|uniref:Large ribosomal subunit protein bL9m n=1 Tax=Ceutorhynchus assimilis TaxID=467358 RepID=A0A9N9QSG8_9CUCU|nr:unnamed protein product [Ceutorhynchus assimilis]
MCTNIAKIVSKSLTPFMTVNPLLHQQIRTTFILKRKFAPQLHKKGDVPKPLRSRHYIYELVEDTAIQKQEDIKVILTTSVEGLGNFGETVSVKPRYAYNHLLLPGLAVYATPENVEKYKEYAIDATKVQKYSSPNALFMMKILSSVTLSVVMNKDNAWTIQPWHIKVSFRKCGYMVPEDAITLPEIPIKGPNLDLENKEFFVTVTMNKTEKVNVRCRLHHWSTDIVERLPFAEKFWEQPSEAVCPEFEDVLVQIPKKRQIPVTTV